MFDIITKTYEQNVLYRFPLEVHMVHVEDKYVGADGTIDVTGATSDGSGLAVLGIFFRVDNMKPQVSSYR